MDEDNNNEIQDNNAGEVDANLPNEEEQGKEAETFPRSYVEELREENKRYRLRANGVDELSQRLHTALVAADGRLQDASDLPYEQAHLEDAEALKAAIDSLIEAKPHLRARRATGDIGAGSRGNSANSTDLIEIIRSLN